MRIKHFPTTDCDDTPYPKTNEASGHTGLPHDSCPVKAFVIGVLVASETPTTVTYQVYGTVDAELRIESSLDVVDSIVSNGETFTVPKDGTVYSMFMSRFCPLNGGWVAADPTIRFQPNGPSETVDVWDYFIEYDDADCSITTEDNSYRKIDGALQGTPPDAADYIDLSTVSETSNERLTEGTELCVGTSKMSGSVLESLSDEDTEEDAIARNDATITDWSSCACLTCPAFKTQRIAGQFALEYRHAQVRINKSGLIPSHTYHATVFFYRRLIGSTGPWTSHTLGETVVNADGTGHVVSPWADIPVDSGYQMRAQYCTMEDIT